MLSVIMLSAAFSYCYVVCFYAEFPHAECCCAEFPYGEFPCAECCYAEFPHAECHQAECRALLLLCCVFLC
jgi:hypothetical protein